PPPNQPPLNVLINAPSYAPFACEVTQATLAISYNYYRSIVSWHKYFPVLFIALLTIYLATFVIEGSIHGLFQPQPSETPSGFRRLVTGIGRSQTLAASIYDGIAVTFFLGMLVTVYGWATIVWFGSVVLDPSNSIMTEQPMNVVVFLLLLIPVTYFVGPYEVQRNMLLVPTLIWLGIGICGVVLLLAQKGALFFSAFALVVTIVLAGLPMLLHRAALDMNLKATSAILLAIGCFLVLAVLFGWSWFAGSAACYLVEPRPL
ncbi:MAG: hypothetical protein WC807_21975, partial [Hyphomicrobium sp.]